MKVRPTILVTVLMVVGIALVRALIPILQRSTLLWLFIVTVAGTGMTWHGAKQIYTAAIHGYVVTGVPERRVYREENYSLFRNNVIGWIILFPIIASGAVFWMLDAMKAQGLTH